MYVEGFFVFVFAAVAQLHMTCLFKLKPLLFQAPDTWFYRTDGTGWRGEDVRHLLCREELILMPKGTFAV
jgi:hypothetical protein